MRDFGIRHILLFLIAIALVILVTILIVRGISGGNQTTTEEPQAALVDYADTSTVMQMTIEGPIVADQDFRSITVQVGATKNTIQTAAGYEVNVLSTDSFNSNSTAYATFLRALDIQGFTQGTSDSTMTDPRGFCPTGERYIFEIVNGDTVSQSYWSTSCGKELGNFRGSTKQILRLFEVQIPGYDDIAGTVDLN